MKAARLLFLTMSFAAWMQAAAYAAPSIPPSQQTSPDTPANTPSKVSRRDESAAPDHPSSHASQIKKTDLPKQPSNIRQRTAAGSAENLHQPGSAKSAGAAKAGSIQNATAGKAQPVRSPSVAHPVALSPYTVRHRGANPAVIGGSAGPGNRNTGAINGTRMNRKP